MTSKQHKLNTIIVDDDYSSGILLKSIIEEYIPELEVSEIYNEPSKAAGNLVKEMPDILFLDVEMPEFSGLDLVKLINPTNANNIVFITGHEKYAIEAIKLGVKYYLLKPITATHVKEVVSNILKQRILHEEQIRAQMSNKLLINRHDRASVVNIDEILYMEADGPYTEFHLTNGQQIRSSKSLGNYKKALQDKPNFIQVHRSVVLNFNHIREILKEDNNGVVVLTNDIRLDVSSSSSAKLIQNIHEILAKSMRV